MLRLHFLLDTEQANTLHRAEQADGDSGRESKPVKISETKSSLCSRREKTLYILLSRGKLQNKEATLSKCHCLSV